MQFGFNFGEPESAARESLRDDIPFRVLVLGDFSGQGMSGGPELSSIRSRVQHVVDLDNFDDVMTRICPSVALPPHASGASPTCLEFRGLEDFTPDRLCRDVPDLAALQKTRRQLEDPVTFSCAAATMRLEPPIVDRAVPLSRGNSGASEDDASMLERLLGRRTQEVRATGPKSEVELWMQQMVAPHVVPDAPQFQHRYIDAVDAAIDDQLRGILHNPAFQALESAWRGLHRLLAGLGADERLQIGIMDVNRQDLVADLRTESDGKASSGLRKRLVQAPREDIEGARWSAFVGLYDFSASEDDAETLTALAGIAAEAGAPFIGEAKPTMFGCMSLLDSAEPAQWDAMDSGSHPGWEHLRRSLQAAWIGLIAPRFMLRLPYGEKTDPTERPQFEEFTAASGHDDYLWGNPAWLVAGLLVQSFLERGWDMEMGDGFEIGELPAHIVDRDGERHLHACAEAFLGERAGECMLECGVMPVMSYRNRNAIRVLRLQSIAFPKCTLAGPWVRS